MKVLHSILFAAILFATNSFALNSQDIENKVNRLLQKNDIVALSNELAQNNSNSTEDLLIKLSVFSRAGHRKRVHKTLQQIGDIYPSSVNQKLILSAVRGHLRTDDLDSLKIYYEKIMVKGDYRVVSLVKLWREKDEKELEKWLDIRAETSSIWWNEWFKLKQSRSNSSGLIDELEKRIRLTPNNYELVERYLKVFQSIIHGSTGGSSIYYNKDVSWLADVVELESASDTYRFALAFVYTDIKLAEKFFNKSLTIPFSAKDSKWMMEEFITPSNLSINLEKQLRYRTKKSLLDIYEKNEETQLAERLKKELSEMDISDIDRRRQHLFNGYFEEYYHYKLTAEEKKRHERFNAFFKLLHKQISEHEKNKEYELAWQKYLKALDKFEYKPNDSWERRAILTELASFGEDYKKEETITLFKKEIDRAEASNDGKYIFSIVRIIDDYFEELVEKLFVNTKLLTKVFNTIDSWGYFERFVIESIVENEKWNKQKREFVCDELIVLAMQKTTSRAFYLAKALEETYPKKAVGLFEKLPEILPAKHPTSNEDDNRFFSGNRQPTKGDAEMNLIDAYTKSNQWNKAEKLYFKSTKIWSGTLGRMSLVSAKQGDVKNAVRLWKLNTNFDRRRLTELKELAKTEAKPLLQEFYLDMKKRDSLSYIPEKALAILK